MKSPTKTTRALMAAIVASSTYLDFWSYSQQYYKDPTAFTSVLTGTAAAPAQYRVGVLKTADFLVRHTHLGLRHAMALLDGLSAAIALYLLYSLLQRSKVYQSASRELRWYGSGAFLVLAQYYLAWLVWYQRPETLPTAALVTVVLWLLARGLMPARSGFAAHLASAVAMVVLAAAQGLVRADVAVALHAGVVLVCLFDLNRRLDSEASQGTGWTLALPRGAQLLTSTLCIAVAGGVQFVMMHVVYPHATYGDTPAFQLLLNFTGVSGLIPFVLFLVPYAWTLRQITRPRILGATLPDMLPLIALLAGSVVYLGLWCVLGKVDEVRIFLPFSLALIPLTVQLSMQGIERGAAADIGGH